MTGAIVIRWGTYRAAFAVGPDVTTPWSWASLPGLPYRPGTTRIVVAAMDVAKWRGRIYTTTSERREDRR